MTREPVLLVNNSGEVNSLPGYGLRYEGEQQFYAFYLNVYAGASGTPFQSGENVVLESRASFFASPLNSSLFCSSCNSGSLNSSGLGFLWNATITARPGSAGLTGVVGTVEVNVTGSQAVTLLNQLMPLNATGALTGSSEALSMTQFELLGLDSQALELSPFVWLSPVSIQGTPPQTILGELGGYIVSGLEFVAGAIVAFGTLVVQIASLVVHALIQFIVGLLQTAYAAVEAAVSAVLNALNFLLQLLIAGVTLLVNTLTTWMLSGLSTLALTFAVPWLSSLTTVNVGGSPVLGAADYSNAVNHIAGTSGTNIPEGAQAADKDLNDRAVQMFAISAIITGTVAVGWAVLYAVSAGGVSAAKGVLTQVANRVFEKSMASLLLKVVTTAVTLEIFNLISSGASGPIASFFQSLHMAGDVVNGIAATFAFVKSLSFFGTTIRNVAKTSIFIILGLAMLAALAAAVSSTLFWVQTTYGTNETMPILYTAGFSILAASFSFGMSLAALARIIIGSGLVFPVPELSLLFDGISIGSDFLDLSHLT